LRFHQLAVKSEVLRFIIENGYQAGDRLPTLQELSKKLKISVAKTREALEIARALGIVDVKPGRGTLVREYSFTLPATLSALYAIGQDGIRFYQLGQMRNALEVYFWEAAASSLTAEDITALRELIASAYQRLEHKPVQVPASEHRAFHLAIFKHLDNPFVQGILEAFWESYEAFGLNLYTELEYHRGVWDYHVRIVDAIEAGDVEASKRLLIEHINLLDRRGQITQGIPA
jgi:DNA-binding FadR family transcriptional regulator